MKHAIKKIITIFFNPSDGKFNFETPEYFKSLPGLLENKRYEMVIQVFKSKRSDRQRKYEWGCVYKLISNHTGFEKKEVNQLMEEEFLSYEKKDKTFVKRAKNLNTAKMEEYLTKVRRFAAMEFFIDIPMPNESSFPYEIKK